LNKTESAVLEGEGSMRIILLASVAVALVACSPPAPSTQGESGGTPAASAPSNVMAQMRPGRWAKSITVMGQTTTEVECVTAGDLNAMANEPNNSHCTSANGFQRTAEGLVWEAQCTGEDGGGSIRTVMNGDMQNSYVADTTMTGAGGMGSMQIHIEGRYEGACRGDE
jgi:hypothetical protein